MDPLTYLDPKLIPSIRGELIALCRGVVTQDVQPDGTVDVHVVWSKRPKGPPVAFAAWYGNGSVHVNMWEPEGLRGRFTGVEALRVLEGCIRTEEKKPPCSECGRPF